MKLTIEQNGKVILEVISDGNGKYKVTSDQVLPRQHKSLKKSYTISDGFHVAGLVQAFFGSNDSREFLRRALVIKREVSA